MRAVLILMCLIVPTLALATSGHPPTQTSANGLIFGNGSINTGTVKPTTGQAVCNVGGVLGGCNSINGVFVHTLSGATPDMVLNSSSVPAVDIENLTLSANVSTLTTPTASAMADGEIIQLKVVQPSGGHNYTLPATFTAGSGTTVVQTSGCSSLPSMPTGTNHALLVGLIYNGGIAELDVVSCVTTGA